MWQYFLIYININSVRDDNLNTHTVTSRKCNLEIVSLTLSQLRASEAVNR